MKKPAGSGAPHLQAAQADPGRGTQSTEVSIEREVGARTPERVHQQEIRTTGVEDNTGQENRLPEMAPKERSGSPAELDRVPVDNDAR